MKNFFKKLAFVLALAMVLVSVAPATANAAAKAPSLKKTSKILYIGGDLTGTIPDSYRFYFNNAAGYTATWESMDEDVVVIEGKTVVAVGVGKAVVKATLTNKAGKEYEREATVWVKQNAEKVGFGSQKAIESPLAVGAKVKINVFRQVGDKKIWTQNDMATCTDVIKWTSSDEKVATVDKWGTVTAVGAGEATITATATQPQGPTKGESASYKVSVVAGLTSATQKNLTTANVTFGKEVTADELKTVKVYQLVGNTRVLQTVKEYKLDDNDKTKATIELYTTMPKNTTYVFVYGDTEKEFVTVDPSVKNVTRVAVEQTVAVKETETDLNVKVYVGDVDVTSALGNNITVSTDATGVFLNDSAKKITMFTVGSTAVVKAVFHTYEYENNQEITKTAEGLITCVEASAVNFKEVVKWSLYNGTNFDFKDGTVKTQLAVRDNMNLAVKLKLTDKTTPDNITNPEDFKFESSNTNVLVVNRFGNEIKVSGVAQGSAVIIVKYKDSVVAALTVTVLGDRAVANIDVNLSKTILSLNPDAKDAVKVTVTLKDQLGDAIDKSVALTAEYPLDAPTAAVTKVDTGKYEIVFDETVIQKEGTYRYKLTVDNSQVRFFSITAGKSSANQLASPSYNLVIGNSKVDTTIKADGKNTDSADVSIKLESIASNGYKIKDLTWSADKAAAEADAKAAADKTAYYYTLEGPDGTIKTGDATHVLGTFAPITTKTASGAAIGTAVKAKAGNYKITAHVVTYNAANASFTDVARDMEYFAVSDNQAKGSLEVKSNQSASATALGAVTAGDFIVVKYNGNQVNDKITKVDFIGTEGIGNTVFIKSVTVEQQLQYKGAPIIVEVKVDVNLSVTFK